MSVPEAKRGVVRHQARTYGYSHQGISLEVYGPPRPRYLIFAGIHGHEPDTVNLLSSVLRSVEEDQLKAGVVLCVNPDGLIRGIRSNGRGVELNRNFPSSNWQPNTVYHRWTAGCDQKVALSPGKSAGSEAETQALIKLIMDMDPRICIALHSPLECLDWEYGPVPELVQWISAETGLNVVDDIGYACPGSFDDWCSENNQQALTYELEYASFADQLARHGAILEHILRDDCP